MTDAAYLHETYRRIKWVAFFLPITILLGLWMVLYLPNLRSCPAWIVEGTSILEGANNLINGVPASGAAWNTFYNSEHLSQPPYLWLTGLFARGDIHGARFFNTLFALLIACLIYLWGRRILKIEGAFAAALLFLVYDQTIIHFRSLSPYNGVGLGCALAALFLCRPSKKKNNLLAGTGLAVAAASHPTFFFSVCAALIVRFQKPRTWLFLFGPMTVYLLIAFGLIYWRFGDWLLDDIKNLFLWYRSLAGAHGGNLFLNFFWFYTQDWFHLVSFVGLLLCFPKRYYSLGFITIIVTLFSLQSWGNQEAFYHQEAIVLPLLSLCWGVLVARAYRLLRGAYAYNLPLLIVFLVVAFCVGKDLLPVMEGNLKGKLQPIAQSSEEAEFVAEWLNERVDLEDLVVANSNIGWMLQSQTASHIQAVDWEKDNSIAKERFRYNPSVERAMFVVLCDVDFRWNAYRPSAEMVLRRLRNERWPLVWQSSDCAIYSNPRFLIPVQ